MFVLDLFELAHLIEARLQAVEQQLIFQRGVGDQSGFEQGGHGLDFSERLGRGHRDLENGRVARKARRVRR